MSASCSSESSESKIESSTENTSCINSRYALYLFSNNKHAATSESSSGDKGNVNSSGNDTKDFEEPSVCLSLLEGNLNAEQETVVRCYLLKTLSAREDLSFENEGKYAELQFSDNPEELFGCYYHRLSKHSSSDGTEPSESDEPSKLHTFFICLIGSANGVMESFCPELGKFCYSLIPLLDPEGLKNQDHMQLKLKSWYFHCVEYIGRCIQRFDEDLSLVLLSSLWGNVEVISEDADVKWDLERFVDTCCLMPQSDDNLKDPVLSETNSTIEILDGKIVVKVSLGNSPYCWKWCDKLKCCNFTDHVGLHNILESFRLKTVQDLNTLKRFLQQAQTNHYALYRAFKFLQGSGYEDLLLYHVQREANMAGEEEVLRIIKCLREFLKETQKKEAECEKILN